jgi:hypothetical protein
LCALKIIYPGSVAITLIAQMWREQHIEMKIVHRSSLGHKFNVLQQNVPCWIRYDFFTDSVSTLFAGIGQSEAGYALVQKGELMRCMPFLFREEVSTVCDYQTHVCGTGLINTGVVDFIQNAILQGEPHSTSAIQRSTDTAFIAGSPVRISAWCPGSIPSWSVHFAHFISPPLPSAKPSASHLWLNVISPFGILQKHFHGAATCGKGWSLFLRSEASGLVFSTTYLRGKLAPTVCYRRGLNQEYYESFARPLKSDRKPFLGQISPSAE